MASLNEKQRVKRLIKLYQNRYPKAVARADCGRRMYTASVMGALSVRKQRNLLYSLCLEEPEPHPTATS